MNLERSWAHGHVVVLYVLVAGIMVLNLLVVAPVLADLRERATRAEQRLLRHDTALECLAEDLPAAYRRAHCP